MKWKQSGTETVFIAVCAVVLVASYGIGLCVREIRFRRAAAAPKTSEVQREISAIDEVTNQPERRPVTETSIQDNARGFPGIERGGLRRADPNRTDRFANMSDEERAQIREGFAGRRRGRSRFENMSEEQRAEFEEQRRQMRERFQNMSEEERQEFRAQMRGRFGGGRRSDANDLEQQESN
jgi:hypothetical protein